MRPYWSLEVSFWCDSFQPTTCICPLCPSSVWFMDKLEGAAKPFTFPSFPASSLSPNIISALTLEMYHIVWITSFWTYLQHFEKAIVAAASYVTLVLVPPDAFQPCVVRYGNLCETNVAMYPKALAFPMPKQLDHGWKISKCSIRHKNFSRPLLPSM